MKTVPRDLFNMGNEVESNLPQSYENEPSEHLKGPSIPTDNGDVLLTKTDLPETTMDVLVEEFVNQQLEVEYEEEFEDDSRMSLKMSMKMSFEMRLKTSLKNEDESDDEDESEEESE